MKIVYVANVRLPTEKAHGFQIMKMCEAFARAGAEVELVVPYRENAIHTEPFEHWGIAPIFSVTTLGRRDFFSLHWLPRRAAFVFHALYFSICAIKYLLHADSSAIVYARDREILFFLSFLRRRFIAEIHFMPRVPFSYGVFLRHALLVVTLTDYLKCMITARGIPDERVLVLPDAVDLAVFHRRLSREEARDTLGLPQDKFIAVYAGQLLAWKGIDILLEATRDFNDRFLILIIGGSIEEHKRFKLPAGSSVRFIARQPHGDLVKWLSAADIGLVPNSGQSALSRHYTSPLKLYEYLAMELPIVCADLPALREALEEGEAVFFESDNPSALAAAIRDLAGNRALRARLAKTGFEKSKTHTWELRAAAIMEQIRRMT